MSFRIALATVFIAAAAALSFVMPIHLWGPAFAFAGAGGMAVYGAATVARLFRKDMRPFKLTNVAIAATMAAGANHGLEISRVIEREVIPQLVLRHEFAPIKEAKGIFSKFTAFGRSIRQVASSSERKPIAFVHEGDPFKMPLVTSYKAANVSLTTLCADIKFEPPQDLPDVVSVWQRVPGQPSVRYVYELDKASAVYPIKTDGFQRVCIWNKPRLVTFLNQMTLNLPWGRSTLGTAVVDQYCARRPRAPACRQLNLLSQ